MVTVNFRPEKYTQTRSWIPRIRATDVYYESVLHFQTHCCRSWFENLVLENYRDVGYRVAVVCRAERGLEDLIL
jgi:hypothetical protein